MKIEERCFNVTLNEGDNWIGIKVDNEGTDPPASVTVKINDGATEQQFAIDGEIDQQVLYHQAIRVNKKYHSNILQLVSFIFCKRSRETSFFIKNK